MATFGLTADDARADENYALYENGHLVVVQWLVWEIGLYEVDVRANDSRALRYARDNGHSDITDRHVHLPTRVRRTLTETAPGRASCAIRAEAGPPTLVVGCLI